MCMSILGKPTDQDLDQYPHVLLTSPHEWDPSVLEYTHPNAHGYPSWVPGPSARDQHDPMIGEYGNIHSRVIHIFSSFLTHLLLQSRSLFSNPQPLTIIN